MAEKEQNRLEKKFSGVNQSTESWLAKSQTAEHLLADNISWQNLKKAKCHSRKIKRQLVKSLFSRIKNAAEK